MAADDIKALLRRPGLQDVIEMPDNSSEHSACLDDEALAKMTLILRILSLPPESVSEVLKAITRLTR